MIKMIFIFCILTFSFNVKAEDILENMNCNLDNFEQLDECTEKNYSNLGMGLCVSAELKKCEEILKDKYDSLYEQFYNKEILKESQEKWFQYRDSDCKINIDFTGRESWFRYSFCKISITKDRIKQLSSYYKK